MIRHFIPLILAVGVSAQAPAPKPQTPPPAPKKSAPAASSAVDDVIALVKGGMSEANVIKTLQRAGKAIPLSVADTVKLQSAGVSERIMDVMVDPKSAVAAPANGTAPSPAAPAPAVAAPTHTAAAPQQAQAGQTTPFPPDLPSAPSVRKRRLAVKPFDYSAVRTWVTYWFHSDTNIGEGIRSMLTARMHQSKGITLLERTNAADAMKEQDFGATNRVKQGTKAKIGNISGADCILYGDIVIFGRDDVKKRSSAGGFIRGLGGPVGALAGRVDEMKKDEKAVVGINLRIVDAETLEVLETAEARGESSRTSKDYSVLAGGSHAVGGGAQGMTSSNFEATIIGEATSNAVNQVVAFLEGKVPKLPAKERAIEGRISQITSNGVYLSVGAEDGILLGDRFEILRIDGEIKDPVTKDVIDVEAVKIGELVVNNPRDKAAIGIYGGQPLSTTHLSTQGKGYAARLMSK